MSDFKVGCGNSKGFSRAGKWLRDWKVKVPRLGWTASGQACTLWEAKRGKPDPIPIVIGRRGSPKQPT